MVQIAGMYPNAFWLQIPGGIDRPVDDKTAQSAAYKIMY